jgi:amino acid permease
MLTVLRSRNRQDAIYNILVFLIYLILLTFFMRLLWNGALVKYVSILKPVDSLWHTFLLALGIAMFRG